MKLSPRRFIIINALFVSAIGFLLAVNWYLVVGGLGGVLLGLFGAGIGLYALFIAISAATS